MILLYHLGFVNYFFTKISFFGGLSDGGVMSISFCSSFFASFHFIHSLLLLLLVFFFFFFFFHFLCAIYFFFFCLIKK